VIQRWINLWFAGHSLTIAYKSSQYQNRIYSMRALFNPEKRLACFVKSDAVKQGLKGRIGAQGIKKGVDFGEL